MTKAAFRGSALAAVVMMTAIALLLLETFFAVADQSRREITRADQTNRAVSLANGGLNLGLAGLRHDAAYAGQTVSVATGRLTIAVKTGPPQTLAALTISPSATAANRVCRLARADVDSGLTPLRFLPSTYQESTACSLPPDFSPPPVGGGGNVPPVLSVQTPALGHNDHPTNGSYQIIYTLTDLDDTVFASFYYQSGPSSASGVITNGSCASAPESVGGGTAECLWNTVGVSPGTYQIFGRVSDGVNPTVTSYALGTVTIDPPLAGLHSISGRVYCGNEPAAGADVILFNLPRGTIHSIFTDSGGNFSFGSLLTGSYGVLAIYQIYSNTQWVAINQDNPNPFLTFRLCVT